MSQDKKISSIENHEFDALPSVFTELPEGIGGRILQEIVSNGSIAVHSVDFINEFLANLTSEDEGKRGISIFFRMALFLINFFSCEDPLKVHYEVARSVLKEDGERGLESDENARDLLARELVRECRDFAIQVLPLQLLQTNLDEGQKNLFVIPKLDCDSFHLAAELNGKLWLDELFIRHLKKIGVRGEEEALQLSKASQNWYTDFQKGGPARKLFRWWIDTEKSSYCRFATSLARVIWKERVQCRFERGAKQLPALTQTVSRPISRFLSLHAQVESSDRCVTVAYEGRIIAETAAVDPMLLSIVTKGSYRLNTIYHHKLLRYECKSGFENWVQEKRDERLLRFEGGVTEIADLLGFKNKEAPSIIKSILHAQAHMNFHFDDGSSGNLIALRQFKSQRTNREEGVEIVLGTQLMPGYTFATDKRNRLLVPIPAMPPFVSSTNSHAGQALLQMLIMEEFTHQSINLVALGSIEITDMQWNDFWKQSGLAGSVFKQVRQRWLVDGIDGGKFLVLVEKNRYTLGESYRKELNFLLAQGKHRKEKQARGVASAKKRTPKKRSS